MERQQPDSTALLRPPCVRDLIEQQATAHPDAVAVVHGAQRLSYGELNRRANRLARHLQGLGIGPDALAGIFMQRSIEMVIGILATLKAGGAYVPLDPSYPVMRIQTMLSQVGLGVVLTTEALRPLLPVQRAPVCCLDSIGPAIADLAADNLATTTSPQNLAYVIFTSGSTGRPKAAAVPHRGWTNLMTWFAREFEVDARDRGLVVSSFSFDITQRSIVMPLVAGGQVHLLASNVYDPEIIARSIAEQQITLLNCAPSAFYPLVEGASASTLERLSSLRAVFLGGEAIAPARLQRWAPAATTQVVNVYGTAECSDVSSFHRLWDYARYAQTSVPIGRPIANTQLYVLDEQLRAVPPGDLGEICIGGDGVGHGYIADDALTAERFVVNAFSDDPGARLYRTGDLGRFAPDGNLEFMGRLDRQVKLRGFRIRLEEIEAHLKRCPGVRDAVVLKQQRTANDERLVAYVEPSGPCAVASLRAALRSQIPEYMVPADFVLRDAMPLNPNGKIDHDALRSLDVPRGVERSERQAPGTPLEEIVRALFAEALNLDAIGMEDDFFDLGGDSLKAVLVVAGVAVRLDTSIALEALFETRTARRFSAHLQAVRERS